MIAIPKFQRGVGALVLSSVMAAFILNYLRTMRMALESQIMVLAVANLLFGIISVAWGFLFAGYQKKFFDKTFMQGCWYWSLGYTATYVVYLLFPKAISTEGLTIVRMLSPFVAIRYFKEVRTPSKALLPKILLAALFIEETISLCRHGDWLFVLSVHIILFIPITISQLGAWKLSHYDSWSGSHISSLLNGISLLILWLFLDKSHGFPEGMVFSVPFTALFIWTVQFFYLYGLGVLPKQKGASLLSSSVAITTIVGIFQLGGEVPWLRLILALLYFLTTLSTIFQKARA